MLLAINTAMNRFAKILGHFCSATLFKSNKRRYYLSKTVYLHIGWNFIVLNLVVLRVSDKGDRSMLQMATMKSKLKYLSLLRNLIIIMLPLTPKRISDRSLEFARF